MSEPTRVLIFGSCVSRDPFNRAGPEGAPLALVDYFARSSLASLALAPIGGIDISGIKSPFQRRMVDRDVRKKFPHAVKTLAFDVLLMDFIDDRFRLLVTNKGQGITDSTAFREAGFDARTLRVRRLSNRDPEFRDYWQKGWTELLALADELGIRSRILINKVFWSTVDDQGVAFPDADKIAEANAYLEWVYDRIAQDLPAEQFLHYDRASFIGKSDHHWGKSPFHYVDSVEEHCLVGVSAHHQRLSAVAAAVSV